MVSHPNPHPHPNTLTLTLTPSPTPTSTLALTPTLTLTRVAALDGAPRVAAPPPTYRMQRDTEKAESSADLRPAHRVPVASAQPVWMTVLSNDQTLSNLRVRWVRRESPPHLPTLDVDTFADGGQLAYERF